MICTYISANQDSNTKENLKTGSDAATNGGFTGVVVMPNTDPAIDNAVTVNYINEKTKDFMLDVYVSAAMTKKREGKQLSPHDRTS